MPFTQLLILTVVYAGVAYVLLELAAKRIWNMVPLAALCFTVCAAAALLMANVGAEESAVVLTTGTTVAAMMYLAVRRVGKAK